ncbi:MAG: cytochrome c biogenesis CcdA family protein [Candidatus Helarchaeota archaeon]
MKKLTKYIGLVCVVCSIIIIMGVAGTEGEEQLSLTFYGQWGCSICHEKASLIESFEEAHPELNTTYLWIPNNISLTDYYDALNILGESSPPPPPAVVLNRSGMITVLFSVDITWENLEAWRLGQLITQTEFTLWIAFITGIITGASACMLLLISVLGTSLTMVESRKKYAVISTGLVIGLIVAYVAVSALFLMTMNALSVLTSLKYIFSGGLLFLGAWQIVEFKREDSVIFGTSDRIKSTIKDFISKKSGFYAFLVGVIFAFIKIPCFGAPYLELLYVSQSDPLLILLINVYILGMLIPIVGVLVAIRIGFQSEKINQFRLDFRPYLRLLSGCLIITLALYFLFDYYISLNLVLWIILDEVIIFVLIIWLKFQATKRRGEVESDSEVRSQTGGL